MTIEYLGILTVDYTVGTLNLSDALSIPAVPTNQRHQRFLGVFALSWMVNAGIRASSPMTILIMFNGFVAAILALTYIEVRRIRKKLTK